MEEPRSPYSVVAVVMVIVKHIAELKHFLCFVSSDLEMRGIAL